MKIGVDIRALAEGQRSGVEEYTINLLNHLLKIDQENEYLFFFNALKKRKIDFPFLNYPQAKLIHLGIPNKLLNFSLRFFHRPYLDRLVGPLDIYFLPNILFASVSKRCPQVLTVHDLSYLHYPQFFSIFKKIWHHLCQPRELIANSTKIIAVSDYTKKNLVASLRVDPRRVAVVHSGLDQEFYAKTAAPNQPSIKKYSLPKKYLLSFGTIEPRKNLLGLISAFEHFSLHHPRLNYHLVLAGSRGWSDQPVREKIDQSRYRHLIHHLGFVDQADKPVIYQLADVLIYPSFYEGFGFPPLEAMAASAPVITTHASSMPEICQKGALLIDPNNYLEISQAISEVVSSSALRQRLIREGRAQAAKFSWLEAARQTLQLFTEIYDQEQINSA